MPSVTVGWADLTTPDVGLGVSEIEGCEGDELMILAMRNCCRCNMTRMAYRIVGSRRKLRVVGAGRENLPGQHTLHTNKDGRGRLFRDFFGW